MTAEKGNTLAAIKTGAAIYVNLSAADVGVVPPADFSVTSTMPAVPIGLVTRIALNCLWKLGKVTAVCPKSTSVTASRFAPVIVTTVPPVNGPEEGLMEPKMGAAM